MKNSYLILAIIGFILPNYFVLLESIETGNFMLYANPQATLNGMFANRISTIFSIDLLFTVFVFFVWSYQKSKAIGLSGLKLGGIWMATLFFGLAGGLPLFLYVSNDKTK